MFNNPGQTQVLQFSGYGYVIELVATNKDFQLGAGWTPFLHVERLK